MDLLISQEDSTSEESEEFKKNLEFIFKSEFKNFLNSQINNYNCKNQKKPLLLLFLFQKIARDYQIPKKSKMSKKNKKNIFLFFFFKLKID